MIHKINYAPDGWLKKGAPTEIKRAVLALKNVSLHTTDVESPQSQKIIHTNNMYDMMINKISKNDPAALSVLTTQGDINCFVNEYNIFKGSHAQSYANITISDLVPDTELGVAAAQARNHLAHALIGDVPAYYYECDPIPEEEDVWFMDQAIELTLAVLTDPSMDTQHPEKQTALNRMSAILVVQNLKYKQLSILQYNEEDRHYNLFEKDFNMNRQDTMARLSIAEMHVLELSENPKHAEVGKAILASRDAQMRTTHQSVGYVQKLTL